MSRLFLLVLGTLGCIPTYQCFRLAKSDIYVASHLPDLKAMKIINGVTADIRDFPYMVSLQYNGTFYGHDYDHYCCGSILNNQWIITSAQCGQAREVNDFQVRVGSSKYYESGMVYNIQNVVVHPKFDEITNDYDVALLKLSKKIKFSESIKPIKLPNIKDGNQDTTNLSIVGWGATELLGKMSDDLHESHIEKISDENCKSVYGGTAVTDRMFCVFTQGFGACVGDSGSPAIWNNKVIGITSWSDGCAYEYPTVYVKVSSVLNWIKATTGIIST